MVEKHFLTAAKNTAERSKQRLEKESDQISKEVESLFHWILNRIEYRIENSENPSKFYSLEIKEAFRYEDGTVLIEDGKDSSYYSAFTKGQDFFNVIVGKDSSYYSAFTKGQDFFNVIVEVSRIFNEIGISKEGGYSYYSVCVTPSFKRNNETAYIRVNLSLI